MCLSHMCVYACMYDCMLVCVRVCVCRYQMEGSTMSCLLVQQAQDTRAQILKAIWMREGKLLDLLTHPNEFVSV